MPTRFSNLTTKPCVSIESKKIELDNSKIIFQCIKATFSKFETNDNFGRTFFKVSLNEMTSNVSLSLYKLNITSLSTINETNINNYLGDQLLLFGVTQKDGIVYEDVDISNVVKDGKTGTSFSVYFTIRCDAIETVNFGFEDISIKEVITGELYNHLKESYFHETIKQELSYVGTGVVDLFNKSLKFNLLNLSTLGKNPISISATYNENRSGIFGEHVTADFEYKARKFSDYIEMINSVGDSIYYQYMTRDNAKKKYGIEPYDTDGILFVNLTDLTYILLYSAEMVLVNKDNSKNMFWCGTSFSSNLINIYLAKIITDRVTIQYERNVNNYVTKINTCIDNNDDVIEIYYTNGIVSKINYGKMRYAKFSYTTIASKKILTSIEYCDNNNTTNDETVHAISRYEYIQTLPYKLSIAYDDTTKIGCKYEYIDNKVSKITNILKDSADISGFINLYKNGNVTRIINNLGKETFYYFDDYGKCYLKSNEDGDVSSIKYQNSNIGSYPNIIGESKIEKNENNILVNGNFEGDPTKQDFAWKINSIVTPVLQKSIGYYGINGLRIYNFNSSLITLTQNITNVSSYINKKLFLKGYIRGTGRISINVKVKNIDNKVSMLTQNLWDEILINDINIPNSINSIEVIIEIDGDSDIRLSNFSLCIDNKCERSNFIQNPKFINMSNNWNQIEMSSSDGVKDVSLISPLNNIFKKAFEINGDLTKVKELKQVINLSGGAGEELLFSYFTKVNVCKNDICYSYMKIEYTNIGTKTYSFGINTNVYEYQKIVQSIITESAYKKVTIGIKYLGKNNAYFSDFGLFKEQFGSYYSFNEKNSLVEIASGSTSTNISLDSTSRVKRITDATGEIFEYTYDGLGNITEIKDSNRNKFKFYYDENGFLKKNEIITINEKTMSLEQTSDSNGNVLTSKDYSGNIIAYEYDEKERLKIQNESNGLVSHFKYDAKDNVIKKTYDIESTIVNHNFSYNTDNSIAEINVENGPKYDFDLYDEWGSLKRLILDNNTLTEFTYYKYNNIYTGLLYNKIYPNGEYHFYYDGFQRLIQVKYEEVTIVEYTYDKLGNMIKKIDVCGETYYSYDSNGLLVKTHTISNQTKKSFLMEYDNLGNLQQKSLLLDNETILNYDYIYKYEFNEYKSGGYFSRLENSFNEDVIFEEKLLKYGDAPILNTVGIKKDLDINRNVLSFTKNTSSLCFANNAINAKRVEKNEGNNLFNKEEWDSSFEKRKEMLVWVKVNQFTNTQSKVKIISFGSNTSEIASVSIDNNGYVFFDYNGTFINNFSIKVKEWNLIGITFEEIQDTPNTIMMSYFVNNNFNFTNLSNNRLKDITRIMLGEYHNSTVTNTQLSGGVDLQMPFDILYASIGEYKHNEDSYKGIYNEGYKYIFTKRSNPMSGIVYYNHNAYGNMDVIPLNGNLNSVKGLKPLEYTYGDSSFSVDKTKIFQLDKKKSSDDNEYTSRHVYGSYKNNIGINGKNKSMLCYDLGLKTEGTISLRFKCDFLDGWNSGAYRTIITCPHVGYGAHELLAYVDNSTQQIKVSYGGHTYDSDLYVFPEKWHLFTLTWNLSKIKINLDDQEYQYSIAEPIDLTNCKTYIGCNYLNNEPCLQLMGSIEMITYSNLYKPAIHNELAENGKPISILTEYDEAERPFRKEINTGIVRLEQNYKYNDDESQIGQNPSMEILPDGTSIVYTYDRSGNVVHKVSQKNGLLGESLHYKYDVAGRLLSEKCYNGSIFSYCLEYKYNNSGDILEKIDYNNDGSIKNKDIYTYSTSIKNQLLKIETFDTDNTLLNTKTFTYPTNDPFRPSSYDGNNLTWQGRRLTSFETNTYEYNSDGIRISKTIDDLKTKYVLDGNKIVKEIKSNNNTIYYHYDENEELVGFNFNGNEYFYYRDITGNISKVVDVNGNIKVEYKYDAWGKVLSTIGNQDLIAANSFLYKGYYYDSEIQMYYCNARYYDPTVCRWISADDSSYLDPETFEGINLWSYCGNNPVMGYDPEGTWNWKKFWKGVAVVAVAAVAVATVAVVTMASGGLGTPVLIGAGVGALTSGLISGTM